MIQTMIEALNKYGYHSATHSFPIGRPDRATLPLMHPSGKPVVAKFYPGSNGEQAYNNMVSLWNSSFGKSRKPPGLPRPVDFLPAENILIMERLEGRPLSEIDPQTSKLLEESIALLADLHNSNVQAKVKRSSKKIIRSLDRKANGVEQLAPHLSEEYKGLIRLLETRTSKDRHPVSSHGDFSPRNILVCSDRVVLIDLDRFQEADPARDVAFYGVWCWTSLLRKGRKPEWSTLHNCVHLYDRLRPSALDQERLSFHVAAGLLRKAHSIIHLWPNEIGYVPALLAEAENQIEQGHSE